MIALTMAATPGLSFDDGGSDDDYPDTGAATSTGVPTLADARNDIGAKHWEEAIDKLSRIVEADPMNADAYNLLGYSFRNFGNSSRAMQAYDKALDLDPNHTGALEYQGVLFVMLGDLDKANANLARIEAVCGTGCEEYEDLAEAIEG
jgi:Flp pilus assembly protein TadD